jgi:hypothetical protein
MWFPAQFQIVGGGIAAALPRLETPQGTFKESVMNLKALAKATLATLVLGSSSLALAAPAPAVQTTEVRTHSAGGYTTTTVVAQADAAPAWHGVPKPPVYRPVTLASSVRLGPDGRTAINVGSQGRFDTLQLTSAAGKTFIKQVVVQFDNGQSQTVGLRRTIDGRDTLTVDLAGSHRAIRRIVVTGNELATGRSRPYGAFTITAS